MAKDPFYKVIIVEDNFDITDFISEFIAQDSIPKSNLITCICRNIDIDLIDNDAFQKGKSIQYMYGYEGDEIWEQRISEIVDLDITYGQTVTLTLKASDQGFWMKKSTSKRIFKNKTSTEIAKEIAKIFDLEAVVDDSVTKHGEMPMSNKNYYQFLKDLSNFNGKSVDKGLKGPYIFFIRNDKLFFIKRKMDMDSVRTFTYGDRNDNVRTINIKYQTVKEDSAQGVLSMNIDKDTNKVIMSDGSSSEEVLTGKFKIVFDVNGKRIDRLALENMQNDSGKNLVLPERTLEELNNRVTAEIENATKSEFTGSLMVMGSPNLLSNSIITIAGTAKRHQGNYYVEEVQDRLSQGSYSTTLTLHKSGNSKKETAGAGKAESFNDSEGPDKVDDKKTVKLIRYDVNGNIIE